MKSLLFSCLILCCLLCACRQETREDTFSRSARELTQQCPLRIDECTTLDSIVYNRHTASCHYYYSLVGASDESFRMMIAEPSFTEGIRQGIANSVEMKPQKKAGLTFVYHYNAGNSHHSLGEVMVAPADYNP